jgi:ornithine cyclodeaminase/alanine dehydrogenase-like protein (mu-crystallin family)
LSTIQGFVALLDAERGSVLALMDSTEITARRTAATTALAASHLARPGSHRLGIVGCGMQARYHVEALLDVAPIATVTFHDPSDVAAERFAKDMANLGIKAGRVAEARGAAQDADIVVTLTTSTRPVLTLADVGPGTFVAGVGADNPSKHELSVDLLRESRVIVDCWRSAQRWATCTTQLISGSWCRRMSTANSAISSREDRGRTAADERFVFDSTGIALQDLAAAEMIYERARASDALATDRYNFAL